VYLSVAFFLPSKSTKKARTNVGWFVAALCCTLTIFQLGTNFITQVNLLKLACAKLKAYRNKKRLNPRARFIRRKKYLKEVRPINSN